MEEVWRRREMQREGRLPSGGRREEVLVDAELEGLDSRLDGSMLFARVVLDRLIVVVAMAVKCDFRSRAIERVAITRITVGFGIDTNTSSSSTAPNSPRRFPTSRTSIPIAHPPVLDRSSMLVSATTGHPALHDVDRHDATAGNALGRTQDINSCYKQRPGDSKTDRRSCHLVSNSVPEPAPATIDRGDNHHKPAMLIVSSSSSSPPVVVAGPAVVATYQSGFVAKAPAAGPDRFVAQNWFQRLGVARDKVTVTAFCDGLEARNGIATWMFVVLDSLAVVLETVFSKRRRDAHIDELRSWLRDQQVRTQNSGEIGRMKMGGSVVRMTGTNTNRGPDVLFARKLAAAARGATVVCPARNPNAIVELAVSPVALDIKNSRQVEAVNRQGGNATVLVNNMEVSMFPPPRATTPTPRNGTCRSTVRVIAGTLVDGWRTSLHENGKLYGRGLTSTAHQRAGPVNYFVQKICLVHPVGSGRVYFTAGVINRLIFPPCGNGIRRGWMGPVAPPSASKPDYLGSWSLGIDVSSKVAITLDSNALWMVRLMVANMLRDGRSSVVAGLGAERETKKLTVDLDVQDGLSSRGILVSACMRAPAPGRFRGGHRRKAPGARGQGLESGMGSKLDITGNH
ncbi:hypothetical protein CMUS01_09552 [Colletotrichum musicola]|uniref:Uncharacterized protein n=1 Tax=Colletotrichum musicola TaxID=2175873 RepID=A0A8H6K813_9PEZI|nr:hypothetical protein CMUS01_09552 [Colletotrichum musicola]